MGMLTRKYKPVAVRVSWPRRTAVPLPDLNVLQRHRERVQMTNDVAFGEAQSPQAREFAKGLAISLFDVWASELCSSEDEREQLLGAVGMAVCLGVGYSAVDDGMRIPSGHTEQCTLAAVTMGSSFLDGFPKPWQRPVFYSLQAGHFLGRTSAGSIPELVDGAKRRSV